jgi:O-methyltransferase involved in polyketide biosynthesis
MVSVDYSKISITAKLVAYFRQFSDVPFASEVAEYVQAREALIEILSKLHDEVDRQNLDGELPEEGKIYAPLLEARYKSIVQLIHKTGMDQVLELASGFSLRGLAMSAASDITYLESDLPGINEEKSKLVADIRAKHNLAGLDRHHIITANALKFGEIEAAIHLLRKDRPLIVVHEGLLNYLSAEERSVVAGNVRRLLSNFPGGAWITPDFTTRSIAENVSQTMKRFRRAVTGITERQLDEAAFENEEAIDYFVRDSGFKAVSYYQADEVPHLSSLKRLGLSQEIVTRMRPRMRTWLLSPQ